MRLIYLIITGILLQICHAGDEANESDGDTSRKILGSSVVTSVSVVMDTGNKKNTIYTDAVGKPQAKPSNPSELASPIDLLNPDRYEFYTFDDNGDLVKRLMSLDEIKSIIATGDSDALDLDSFTAQGFLPEKRVSDVINNVQSVLKEEMEILKDPISKPIFDTPDVSDSWSMILPAVFGNSGEDIKPEKPIGYVTPDTIMLEPNSQVTHSSAGSTKLDLLLSSIATTKRPTSSSTKRPISLSTMNPTHITPIYYSSSPASLTTETMSSTTEPSLNVEIFSNSISTTDNQPPVNSAIKPDDEFEIVPTRIPIMMSTTKPALVRNVTKVTNPHSITTQMPTSINSISTQASTSFKPTVHVSTTIKPQTTIVFSSSLKPSSQKLSSTTQELPNKSTSLNPSTTHWSSTSFRPSSTTLSGTSYKTPTKTSSTLRPTMSPVPNIFGLPSFINSSIKPASTQATQLKTKPINTLQPTKAPSVNLFGLPLHPEQKNNPSTLVTSTASSVPVKTTSAISTTVSQISINPQLSTTSTVGNMYSSSFGTRISTTSEATSAKITTERNIEKVVLANTNVQLTTKQKPKFNLTSTEAYIKPTTWAPNPEDAQLFSIFKDVLAQSTIIDNNNNKNTPSSSIANTEYLVTDTTNINDALNFEFNKIQTTDRNGDLNTLPTEYVQHNISTTTESDVLETTTKLPPLLNSLNDKQKISASELLDQLLLTTNIYEINTELASPKVNLSDMDVRFDNTDTNSTLLVQDSEQQMTTTDHDIISYPPTTDITLIQSIEQLLSQAVGDIQNVLNQTTESTQSILPSSQSESIINFSNEAETLESDITTPASSTEPELLSTTLNNPGDDEVTSKNNDNLNGSVESLLSQVNDNTVPLNQILFTEKPNIEVTFRRVEDNEPTVPSKATTQTPTTNPGNTIENEKLQFNVTDDSHVEHKEAEQETTTFYYVLKKSPRPTTTEETSHLINITVLNFDPIKNRTKPAKADLSLEQELIAEELKNLTILQSGRINNTIEPSELLKESETKVIFINSTSTDRNQVNKNTELADLITDPTTPQISIVETTIATEDETTEQYITSTSEIEATTNNLRFAEQEQTTVDISITENTTNELPIQSSTVNYSSTVKSIPKPSIVIGINNYNTIVTENGKLIANKTIATPPPLQDISKKATQTPADLSSTSSAVNRQKNSTQDQTWTLVSTVAPQHASGQNVPPPTVPYPEVIDATVPVDLVPKPMQGFGLEESTSTLDIDVHQFAQLCNELAFGFWKTVTTGLSSARSIFVSPFAATSMLAMVFLGAKGATSEEMNEILKLDDMVTFNPHLTFKSVSESITNEPGSGIATAAMIKELFSDRSKGKLLDFYKNRVRAFYDGFVEEVSFREIGDVIRRRSNLLVKKDTHGKYPQFLNDASIIARPPLVGVSINIFETDCSQTSTEGRDGELHFVVLPSIKQRRLVPIPAVVYKSGFLAGYEPSLDATAVALGNKDQALTTILVIPGQQGIAAPGDGLARLEKRLVESSFKKGAWSRLLRSLIPRPGLEVQIPKFSHRSVINATNTLQRMGLHELFNPDSADLRGLNGVANELHLSDVLQINKFATCGEKRGDDTHHSEVYPATTMRARSARRLQPYATLDQDEPRDYQRAFHDPLHDPLLLELPLSLRPRQARIPEIPRLRFDRPFLYFVRHNPTGLILHMGRFNPRLLP